MLVLQYFQAIPRLPNPEGLLSSSVQLAAVRAVTAQIFESGFDTFTAGWLYTHALLQDLLSEYNVDRNVHGLKLAAKFCPAKKNINSNDNNNDKKKT